MASTIIIRNGTKTDFINNAIVLEDGELGYCSGEKELFVGDPAGNTLIGTVLLDEDDLGTDSDAHAATQQSIKTYIDNYSPTQGDITDTKSTFEDAPEVGVYQTSGWRFPYGWIAENCELPPRLYYTENTRTGGKGKYAYGADAFNQGPSGTTVGSWEIAKWYALDNAYGDLTISIWMSGTVNTIGYTASPPGVGESWYGEDDAFIGVIFYDELRQPIDIATDDGYSDTGSDADHVINGDRNADNEWIEISHNVTVPANTKYVKINIIATDGGDAVFSKPYRTSNAQTQFDDYNIDYDRGIHEITNIKSFIDNTNIISGLERINEGNGDGWRLIGRTAANYGPIGTSATDFSISTNASETRGAFGAYALCSGFNTTASGIFSFATGVNSIASGDKSFACGESYAAGDWSFAAGRDCIATGDYSVVMGYNHEATGAYSFSVGRGNVNTADYAITIGETNEATAVYAFAAGRGSVASADYAVAIGGYADATQFGAVALGYNANASGIYTTAFSSCEANGGYSFACGAGTYAKAIYSFVCGSYNLGSSSTTRLEVGIGTGTGDKKNGLEVYTSGSILAPELTEGILNSGSDSHLITKEWSKYGLGKDEGPYNDTTVLTNTTIPFGFSHIYQDTTGNLDIGWATFWTDKVSTQRGFQFIIEDVGSNYYIRNQTADGGAWDSLDRIWTSDDGSFLRNDQDDTTTGNITINKASNAFLIVGTSTGSGVDAKISIEGARTASATSEIAALNFKNDTSNSYDMGRIICFDPDGSDGNKVGQMVFKTGIGAGFGLGTAMTIEKTQEVTFEQDINAKSDINIGPAQESSIVYNSTENSIDFVFS